MSSHKSESENELGVDQEMEIIEESIFYD